MRCFVFDLDLMKDALDADNILLNLTSRTNDPILLKLSISQPWPKRATYQR